MKMSDLKYYMHQIENELDEQSYRNAIQSLRLSIPYWDKEEFGMFASKVQAFVDELPDEHEEESEKIGMTLAAKSTTEELKGSFIDYLVNQGYSVTTPKGRPSTVYDYAKRIRCICERESITWSDLASQIDYYCSRYEIGGSEEEYGSKSHNAPRAALQCFKSFLHENRRD